MCIYSAEQMKFFDNVPSLQEEIFKKQKSTREKRVAGTVEVIFCLANMNNETCAERNKAGKISLLGQYMCTKSIFFL